jgi:hypothetical protein
MSYGCKYVDITDDAYDTREGWTTQVIDPQRDYYNQRMTINVLGLPEDKTWIHNVPDAELEDGSKNKLNIQQLLSGTTILAQGEDGQPLQPPYNKALQGKYPGTMVLECYKDREADIYTTKPT